MDVSPSGWKMRSTVPRQKYVCLSGKTTSIVFFITLASLISILFASTAGSSLLSGQFLYSKGKHGPDVWLKPAVKSSLPRINAFSEPSQS